jgi:hypothetical protein
MTVIRPNSISGITSITAQGDTVNFFKSDGNSAGLQLNGVNFNTTTGVSTFLSLVVTGNVSIAGTLTYEDVTNVDSIGIVTARSGVRIDAGGIVVVGITTVAAGTVAAPSISPTGDSDTGIFFPSADTIAFGEGGAEAARINSSGRLLVNTSTARALGTYGVNQSLQIETPDGGNWPGLNATWNRSSDGFGPRINLAKSRSSAIGGNTVVQNGDELGGVYFYGADGTDLESGGASIVAEVDGTPGANDMPGRLVFATTADGASSPTERMRIDSSGRLAIGTTSPQSKFVVSNGGADGLEFTTNSDQAIVSYNRSTSAYAPIGLQGSQIVFSAPTERARIDASGTNSDKRTGLLVLGRTRGTAIGSNTAVVQDDAVGMIEFKGNDGTNFVTAATIKAQVDGAISTDDMPGRLVFSTTADGASSPTERMRIDSSGRLLVGTSSARSWSGVTSQIQLEGTDYNGGSISQTLNSNNTVGALLALNKSRGTSNGSQAVVQSGDQIGSIYFNGADGNVLRQAARIEAIVDGTPGVDDMPGRLVFSTTADGASSPTERMRIDSSGRLAIGTASPVDALHVLSSGGNTRIDTSTNAGTASLLFDVPASNGLRASGHRARISCQHEGVGWDSSLVFYAGNTSTTPSEAMRIDASRRLLVGTSTGDSNTRLHVSASENTSDPMATDASITIANTVNAGNNEAAALKFNLGNTNTASISAHYDAFSAGVNSSLRFYTQFQSAFNAPTERMRIDNLGYIFSVPTYNNSTATASNMGVLSSGIFYRSTSSIKYKTEVEDIDYAYSNALLKCRPVWYRSTCKADPAKHGYWGFIAEEVAKIDPRLVHWKTVEITYDDKGATVETPLEAPEPEGVQYDRFVPHLLNLIKRQGEAITDLQAEVAALKAK